MKFIAKITERIHIVDWMCTEVEDRELFLKGTPEGHHFGLFHIHTHPSHHTKGG
jgi:hypothetical protein